MNFKTKEIEEVLIQGGGTFTSSGLKANFDKGYLVSLKGTEVKIKLKNELTSLDVAFLTAQINKIVSKQNFAGYYVGFWSNDGYFYIDKSIFIFSKNEAFILGYQNNQQAIFDCKNKESLYLKYQKSGTITQQKAYVNYKINQLRAK